MSVTNIQRIADDFTGRIAHLDRVPDPIGLLIEFTTALARDTAETVFFKVQTEPGWDQAQAQELVDATFHEMLIATTDSVHAHGGTIEMAQELVKAGSIAYGSRLAELRAAYRHGGAA